MIAYHYHGTQKRAGRLEAGLDHCDSEGPVYDIAALVRDGRVADPELDANLTTTTARLMIYAVDASFRFHVAFDGVRGQRNAVKHETLFHNAPVLAAGEIEFLDGIVTRVNDRSGSYVTIGLMKTNRGIAEAILKALQRAGAPMSDSALDYLMTRAD